MAAKAITGFGSERAEAKGPVWDVAVDGIAARGGQAEALGPSTASTEGTYLEAPQPPPALIQHHLHSLLHHWHHHLNSTVTATAIATADVPSCIPTCLIDHHHSGEEHEKQEEHNPIWRHVAMKLKWVGFVGRGSGDGDGFLPFVEVFLIWWIINKCQEDWVCGGGGVFDGF